MAGHHALCATSVTGRRPCALCGLIVAMSSSISNRVSLRCTCLLSLLSPPLILHCGLPLPLLLSTTALLLCHFEKLPPSSLHRWAPRSRILPRTIEPAHSAPLRHNRHLLPHRADASSLTDPAIDACNRSTGLASASTSARDAPPWEAHAGESPTAPLLQIKCPPHRLPP
jgi:hypothetical protein